MDVWGAGCVLFELIALFPIFPGVNEIDQINRIHRILGSPSEEILMKFLKNGSRYSHVTFQKQGASGFTHLLPGTSELCLDLLTKMLAYDVSDRIASGEALKHPYFKEFEDRIINHDPLSVSDEHVRPDANYSSTITVPDKPSMHMEKKTLNPTICTVDSLQNDSKVGKMTACFVDSTKRQPVLTQQRHSKFFNQASNIKRPKPVTNINHNQIRLPSIENSKRVITRVTERNKVEMNKLQYKIEKPIRNKLYASVVSSGYGSSYIPASLSHKNQGQSSSQLLGRKGNVHLSSIR
jgi:serine/threonine protein kinase